MTFELPRSPLPDDPASWDRLARRIVDEAAAPLADYAARSRPEPFGWFASWFGILSRRAPWLVATSAAATLLLWIALPPRAVDPALGWIESSVAPHDLAGALLGGSLPPTVDSVMLDFPPAHGAAEPARGHDPDRAGDLP